MSLDTLKTVSIGAVGVGIQFVSMLPDIVKVAVGVVTVAYWIVKIRKELKG